MEIPLTSFIDFVLKSGTPKMTCAKKIKSQIGEPYDPATDYYKRFREAVLELHKNDYDKKDLSKLIGELPTSKAGNYQEMIAGYKKFLGNKKYKWHQPTRKFWIQGSLNVVINPEIALEWDGKKYFIKLYLKSEKPSKDRFSSILALMKTCLGNKDFNYGLLDVRSSKLYLFEENMLLQIPLIEGEARSLEFILEKL